MLFRDVPSLLIIFVLTMPQPLRKGTHHSLRPHRDTTREQGACRWLAPQGQPHYRW